MEFEKIVAIECINMSGVNMQTYQEYLQRKYLEQVLGQTPNWQDREIWFSLSNNTLKYKAPPQGVLVFPFLSLV